MLLYDKGDPIRAVEILGPDIRSVHVKDANRPTVPGTWGEEVPLGQGQTNTQRVRADAEEGRLPRPAVHRARGRHQEERFRDIAHGVPLSPRLPGARRNERSEKRMTEVPARLSAPGRGC